MAFSLPSRMWPFCVLACLCASDRAVTLGRAQDSSAASKKIDFTRNIYPMLRDHCFRCHQGTEAKSGVRLDLRAELLGETNGKRLVQIGDSSKSKLIQLVTGTAAGKRMPPTGARLTMAQAALLRDWIDQGLAWDNTLLPPLERSSHWAFQPVKKPVPPLAKNRKWPRNPIDSFIAAGHEMKGLAPAAEAERRVLVRRLFLDLTGLPPTLTEMDAALADSSTRWYEDLVERLLASPRHGERWGRHWLDVARWAESEGYESDHARDYAWRYRDYVVQSFNADKPFDRFLLEQIAGDEITPSSDTHVIATGFLAAARLSSNEEDIHLQRNDMLVDIVNATGNAFLGLTFHCAQCHSHKFDPITARDYYRFQGFFVNGAPNNLLLRDPRLLAAYDAAKPPGYDAARKRLKEILAAARAKLVQEAVKDLGADEAETLALPTTRRGLAQEKLARQAELKLQISNGRVEKEAAAGPDKDEYAALTKKLAAWDKHVPDPPQTFGFYAPGSAAAQLEVLPMRGFYPPPYRPEELIAAKPHLLIAGDVHQRGDMVDVGWPAVFGPTPREAVAAKPRTALAKWLGRPDHPLTARVWVNRLWQWHFGRGLVVSAGDFGTRGSPPSHPELLDWLAAELVQSGWSTRHVHRLIVSSSTYRQAATAHPGNTKIDPDNEYLWKWTPRRLEAEALRDCMLAVSGELDASMGGPSDKDETKSLRRTLYLFQKRNKAPEVQKLLDGPGGATESCAKRTVSTAPLQALYLLNSDFAVARGKALAERVRRQAGPDRERQIETAFRLALGRSPDAVEKAETLRFYSSAARGNRSSPGETQAGGAALAHLCQALLNLNEFAYLE